MSHETLVRPVPERVLSEAEKFAERKHLAKSFLSNAKGLVHNHGRGVEPMQTVFGHDVLPEGIVRTDPLPITRNGEIHYLPSCGRS